ncbi:MAG TPA: flagellar biosynthetic protein FliR [Candidatus Acidoferrales bacterium]|nr:flagellar biosynthetic protein FliR [Candidatus Acidoferrales bacterium]
MHTEPALSAATLCGFLLVLARVGGAMIFVPLPGMKGGPEPARAALALGFTLALFGQWPQVAAGNLSAATLAGWVVADAAVGIAIGVSVGVILEAFTLAAQVLGLQAGYAYASTVDPNTEADSGVLLVFAQLVAGLLFFAIGLDREVLRLFAQSLSAIPPGQYVFGAGAADRLIHLVSILFSVGLRLALPVVALLIMVDVALALLGRLNSQLQLLTLAFPAKMLVALLVLSWLAAVFPRLMKELGEQLGTTSHRILGI